MVWRTLVAFPQRFSPETCEFLDKFHTKGKLSRVGTFHVTTEIGNLVPYELLPLKVKRLVNMMPISRTHFKGMAQYKSALVNLFLNGYMPDVDKAIITRARYWNEFRRKWQIDNPRSTKEARDRHMDQQLSYSKIKEDHLLQQEFELLTGEIPSLVSSNTPPGTPILVE